MMLASDSDEQLASTRASSSVPELKGPLKVCWY